MKIHITLIITIGIIFSSLGQNNAKHANAKGSKITAETFLNTIDSLGYFKYTDVNNLKVLKQSHIESFSQDGS